MKDKVTMDQTIIILKSNENMRNGNTFYLNLNTTSPFLPYIHHLRLIVALFLSRNRATRAANQITPFLRAPTIRDREVGLEPRGCGSSQVVLVPSSRRLPLPAESLPLRPQVKTIAPR